MAGGVEITGERVIWPTGLGFLIQEHRENERVKGKSPRPTGERGRGGGRHGRWHGAHGARETRSTGHETRK